jgi:lipopolysaccharide transport system ATP-binding protein
VSDVITLANIGKAYRQYAGRWSRLLEWMDFRGKPRHHLHWVLRHISFSVSPGEAIALVGVNGSGKSTLLKMIAKTLSPTEGSLEVRGKVAALLELGMGFHPEFTGRQNALLAGQLLGLESIEVLALMPQIEAFAEIGEYIDLPVRVYSSGMQMRLAFSVATARRPDVLIIDEALSVGDAYFQHKSFDRIRQFRQEGTTLLIVSHDKAAIMSICDRAILLHQGHMEAQGKPEMVLDIYNALIGEKEQDGAVQLNEVGNQTQVSSGTGEARIVGVSLLNSRQQKVDAIGVGEPVSLQVEIEANTFLPELVVGYAIKDRLGQVIFGTNTHHHGKVLKQLEAHSKSQVDFHFDANLGEGHYSVAIALHASDVHTGNNYEWRDLALVFSVVNMDKANFVGSSWIEPSITINS